MRPLPIRGPDDSIGLVPVALSGLRRCFGVPKRVVLIGHPVLNLFERPSSDGARRGRHRRADEPLDVPLIQLPETIEALRGDQYLGANITVPTRSVSHRWSTA